MKKILPFLMLAVIMLLTSCSQDDTLTTQNGKAVPVTFRLTTDKALTRAEVTGLARYEVEVYTKDNLTTPYREGNSANGELSLVLPQGEYTCLFWADYGESNYDANDLKAISRKPDATNPIAYCLKKDITVTDGSVQSITLKHAVAAIRLIETKAIQQTTMSVTFTEYYNGFNVMDGNVVGAGETFTSNNVNIDSATGETTIASFYTFAPVAESIFRKIHIPTGR